MAKAVVLSSGSGTNFQAIAEAVAPSVHKITLLICDRKDAACFIRAGNLNVPSLHISYFNRTREDAEKEILSSIEEAGCDIIFLAGFMRLVTPRFIDSFAGPIINIHPALLPKYPGTHGIEESYASGDMVLGITIHRVDYGMDTGPVICQKSFKRRENESLEDIEKRIHMLEHLWYPKTALELLDKADLNKG